MLETASGANLRLADLESLLPLLVVGAFGGGAATSVIVLKVLQAIGNRRVSAKAIEAKSSSSGGSQPDLNRRRENQPQDDSPMTTRPNLRLSLSRE